MAFSFGFSNGDSEDDVDNPVDGHRTPGLSADPTGTAESLPPKVHKLEDLLTLLPERLSYSTVRIVSPLGKVVNIPRRELYDVRTQLLGEGDQDEVVDQLDRSDISKGVYEGGFKTWECSVDLASLLLDRGPRKDIDDLVRCDQIVELGAGSALPSLILFRHALLHSFAGLTFTLADYNEEVLRLVTLPNLVLTWAASTKRAEFRLDLSSESAGDLEITPMLLDQFVADLRSITLSVGFISGSWGSSLADLIPTSAPDMGMVVLGAETIYSPESTAAFVEVLASILSRVKMAKAIVGAKRMYFGVGGSVDGLKEVCRDRGMVAYEIENHGVPEMGSGVGRALIEIQVF